MNPRFSLLLLAAALGCAQTADFQPYPMDWRDNANSLSDVSFLLDAPAGKRGFIGVRGGHFATADGARFRIWGVNATAAATVPAREDAPDAAAHLARFGVNCVRFHFLDRTAPNGIVEANRNDTRAFDPAQLDRFDFFVAELKKRGIYSNINLNVGRTYKPGDGVRDPELIGFAKTLTYFDGRLLELQREYARALLTHRNPYTGSEYRHEPAVAIVELVNENSIVEAWIAGRLLGKAARKNPGTWTDIPESYERVLTARYNAWLRRHAAPADLETIRAEAGGGETVPRLAPAEFARASRLRFHTEASFYMEIEREYFRSMGAFLKRDLGVRSLVAATSDHNHGISGYPLVSSMTALDFIDGHVYWQHPRYLTDPATGRQTGFEIGNTPMVKEPLNSTVVQLSRTPVAGKPYTVSEVNHPFPNEYACEGIPILSAYAALHDWDGIFWYTFEHKTPADWRPVQPRYFEIRPDPVKMSQIAAGAVTFLRGDVAAARGTIVRSYTPEQVRESIRLPRGERPYFSPGFPLAAALAHATRVESFERAGKVVPAEAAGDPLVSDTGELRWRKAGLVSVDTARSQSLIGYVKANRAATANLAAEVANDFCALTLVSLDGRPIPEARRMLLTAGARAANAGMRWNGKRTSLEDWGKEPTVIEPVTGAVVLRGLERARSVEARALDSGGKPLAAPLAAERTAEGFRIRIGSPATVWYSIAVGR